MSRTRVAELLTREIQEARTLVAVELPRALGELRNDLHYAAPTAVDHLEVAEAALTAADHALQKARDASVRETWEAS